MMPISPIPIAADLRQVSRSLGMKKCAISATKSGPAPMIMADMAAGTRLSPMKKSPYCMNVCIMANVSMYFHSLNEARQSTR